ncbi:MAG TPA: dockerin type I repeat-containing protein [Clostridiaceae bacterium]|nr:dockerin type I repeat-containing protein [Clostridia bacterium]HJJ18404.1 dockerin type I repeat-containing protein [Clostridiaceae bacterium]
MKDGIEEEGIYKIVAIDKAGNTTSVSFQIVEPSDEDYKFKEDKILNISADTNKEKFSQMANIDVNYKIIRNSKELTEEESIVTGDILQMESGQEYKLIVKGDVNSDGVANIKDVIVLRKYLLMKNNLNEVEQLAADTDLDGKTIGIKDLVRMRIIVITQGVM